VAAILSTSASSTLGVSSYCDYNLCGDLTATIEGLEDGSTLYIEVGNYIIDENTNVGEVSLIGRGRDTVIYGGELFGGNNLHISNFTFRNGTVYVGSNSQVDNMVFEDADATAVHVYTDSENTTINDNTFTNCSVGVYVLPRSNNITVKNNVINGMGKKIGIYIHENANNAMIYNNTVSNHTLAFTLFIYPFGNLHFEGVDLLIQDKAGSFTMTENTFDTLCTIDYQDDAYILGSTCLGSAQITLQLTEGWNLVSIPLTIW